MSGAVVTVTNLEKGYPSGGEWLPVLRGVDLALEPGEVVALTGPSGVGKSTLLHLVAGLDRPNGGVIEVDGVAVSSLMGVAMDRYRNRKVGIVYQFHFLLPEFSALENAMVPGLIAGVSPAEAARVAGELLEWVGLGGRSHHMPSQLSGGEQQRASLARALANHPDLLLADEPTGNLDESTAEHVFQLLLKLRREMGLTVLLATHNGALAARCDRTVRLHEGRLEVGPPPGPRGGGAG